MSALTETLDVERLRQLDADHVLHPYTTLRDQEKSGPLMIRERGEGCYVWDAEGKRYFDGMSGLWLVNLGYGREELAEVARDQMEKLAYLPVHFGYGNPPVIELAAKLAELAPGQQNHVLFSSSGSEAVEAAIKAAHVYFEIKDQPNKAKIISRRRSYHGMTRAAHSATGLEGFRGPKASLDPNIVQIEPPDDIESPGALEEKIQEEGPDTVAAFLAEPITAAGGIDVPPDHYYDEVRAICDRHDVLFILDEVTTAFGRSGRMFGIEKWGDVEPDLTTIGKGLTSGYTPLSATLFSDGVWDVLTDTDDKFSHGHTFSGYPVGCRIALRTIEILQEENLFENAMQRGEQLRSRINNSEVPGIDSIRGIGLINAIEFTDEIAQEVFDTCLEKGLILRAINETSVGTSPPLIVTEEQIDELVNTVEETVEEVT